MNHIHQIIWDKNLNVWIVASELAKRGKKRGSILRKALMLPLLVHASAGFALPTGNQVVAGSVNVTTPTAAQMQINQSSQKAIVNWQGFSIGQNESVNIHQPNANAALLNRVVGQDASNIQGRLNANGQVYLTNPNGVIFSKTAQVDVGGLIASTHAISNRDFLNGKLRFIQGHATVSVINHGQIKTPQGGVVALIGEQVQNTGHISTPKGTTALASGKTVDLDMQGDGLVEVKITEAAIKAQINNSGIIQADGGQVVMTARAAGQLLNTVINNQGIIEARGLVERNGKIVLSGGDNGVVQVSGTLDASGQQAGNNAARPLSSNTRGGNITVSGKQIHINNGATLIASGDAGGGTVVIGDRKATSQTTLHSGSSIAAQARDHGKAGTIEVLANKDNGTVKVEGQLNASAPRHGDGGFIDTSAAHVKVTNTAKITTKATNGKTGTWLIDPIDFTISAGSEPLTISGIGASTLSASLGTNGMIIKTDGANSGNGDIFVNAPVNWSANLLTLSAHRNININANLNGSGTAKLALQYGQASADGGTNDNYFINNGAKVLLPAGANFSTQKGTNVDNLKNYTVITTLGAPGSITTRDLQGMNGGLNLNYALGADIDASETSNWNSGEGFNPVGGEDILSPRFRGNFDGLGHTITGLTINRPLKNYIGLFGITVGSRISNVGLVGSSFVGQGVVGGLVGSTFFGSIISNSYATGSVKSSVDAGGLVGQNDGTINNSYASGSVTGTDGVGGLAGSNVGTISNTYTTSSVNGTNHVGGLVGHNHGDISNVYATGSASGTSDVGGLVGENFRTISNAYAEGSVEGTGNNVGGLVGNNVLSRGEDPTTIVAIGTIRDTYATGSVTANGNNVGGLVGINDGTISNSNATGSLETDTFHEIENIGGLVGLNTGSISNAFATGSMGFSPNASKSSVGGLVGSNTGSISNAYATGSVDLVPFITSSSVGGLVGNNSGTIIKAYATGNVAGGNNVGGLVGTNTGKINEAHAKGSVDGFSEVGGLVGSNGRSGNISNAEATGVVTGRIDTGGLVGENSSDISNARATGSVTSVGRGSIFGKSFVGGLVGNNTGAIRNVYATGRVKSFKSVGGLVGNNSGIINNARATGEVIAIEDEAGGLVGTNNGGISDAYSTGSVTGINSVGGLVGENSGDINHTHASGNVSGSNAVGGLVGNNSGTINRAYATGNVNGSNDVGGLVGQNSFFDSLSNSHYDIDKVLINGDQIVTEGGVYHNQFMDWLTHDKTLNIANYACTLPLDSISGYYTISSLQGMKDLLGFADNPSNKFRLGADINLSTASGYFIPTFAGKFDGAGHIISNLEVNQPFNGGIGMFGQVLRGGEVKNLGLSNVNIRGRDFVGGLVGQNREGSLSNVYAQGSVTGVNYVGGLVGDFVGGEGGSTIKNAYATGIVTGTSLVGGLVGLNNNGTISNVYATVSVHGGEDVGGLVGTNGGTLSNAYATGSVTGADNIGGLVGDNSGGFISNAYATGGVTGTNFVGGLVGNNGGNNGVPSGTISNSFWDTQSTGRSNGVGSGDSTGATGKNSADMKQPATFKNAGWDISDKGGSTAVWRIYEGKTTPLLRSFLTPLKVTAKNDTKTYNGLAYNWNKIVTYTDFANKLINPTKTLKGELSNSGNSQGAINAGAYVISPTGLYSDQQGYDISFVNGNLTINPKPLSGVIINNPTKRSDGNMIATLKPINYKLEGFIGQQNAFGINTITGTYASANPGNGILVTATLNKTDFRANTGTNLDNYIFPVNASGSGSITTPDQ